MDDRSLRVLTCNIYNTTADWERRRPVLIEGIRQLSPDLIALQETVLTSGYDQATDVLGDRYQIVNSRARLPNSWGASIASRWPMRHVHELDQSVSPRAEPWCTTMIAEIDAPEPFGPLLFVNHFQSAHVAQELEREQQALLAARFIERLVAEHDHHVILVGDLNAGPEAASVRFWMGRQSLDGTSVCYLNAWDRVHPGEPGHTFTTRSPLVAEAHSDWPYQRLDHILLRFGEGGGPSLDITRCEIAFDQPSDGVWPSDHFGLVADFSVPG
jgi:endonuclease/exonuclease/phosphatase family metal-dependent hydrolase